MGNRCRFFFENHAKKFATPINTFSWLFFLVPRQVSVERLEPPPPPITDQSRIPKSWMGGGKTKSSPMKRDVRERRKFRQSDERMSLLHPHPPFFVTCGEACRSWNAMSCYSSSSCSFSLSSCSSSCSCCSCCSCCYCYGIVLVLLVLVLSLLLWTESVLVLFFLDVVNLSLSSLQPNEKWQLDRTAISKKHYFCVSLHIVCATQKK